MKKNQYKKQILNVTQGELKMLEALITLNFKNFSVTYCNAAMHSLIKKVIKITITNTRKKLNPKKTKKQKYSTGTNLLW